MGRSTGRQQQVKVHGYISRYAIAKSAIGPASCHKVHVVHVPKSKPAIRCSMMPWKSAYLYSNVPGN